MSFTTWLLSPFQAFGRHRSLTVELSKREVRGQYRGAALGAFWSLASPFILLVIYSFAFGTVLGGRWPDPRAEGSHYSVVLFSGLIVYFVLSECIVRAPSLVVENTAYVKRVVFPLEILPWPVLVSALFHFVMNTLVFVVLQIFLDGEVSRTLYLLPVVLIPFVILSLGAMWLLASLGVFVRDISQVIGMFSMALLFLSSAMVPTSAVPDKYRLYFQMNPLTPIVDESRKVMLWSQYPDWKILAVYGLVSTIFMYLAFAWFNYTKKGFADVL